MRFTTWVPIPAVAKQRARLTRRRKGRPSMAYTPEATKHFENAVAEHVATLCDGPMFAGRPVCVSIDVHKEGFQLTVEDAECSVRPVGLRGDLDNYVKSISDACNGVLWNDDRQVELLTIGFVGEPRKGTFYVEDEE